MQGETKPSFSQAAMAGFTATGSMTAFLLLAQPFLPARQQYALSPELIMGNIIHRLTQLTL